MLLAEFVKKRASLKQPDSGLYSDFHYAKWSIDVSLQTDCSPRTEWIPQNSKSQYPKGKPPKSGLISFSSKKFHHGWSQIVNLKKTDDPACESSLSKETLSVFRST